jgi:hypothetical protein
VLHARSHAPSHANSSRRTPRSATGSESELQAARAKRIDPFFLSSLLPAHILSAGKRAPSDKVPSCKAKEFHRPWNSVERLIVKKRNIAA